MAEVSRSFRIGRSDSYLSRIVGRSKSSSLVLESISKESDMVASYERVSQSMRFPAVVSEDGQGFPIRKDEKTRSWRRFLTRAFSRREGEEDNKIGFGEKKEKRKKRSSWLPDPDPDRRWPVQGW